MESDIKSGIRELVIREELDDPSWILSLDEYDEPPLFTRIHQVEFLRQWPEATWLAAMAEAAISVMETIAVAAAKDPRNRTYFISVTFRDFDTWYSGEQSVPTLAVLADPEALELRCSARLLGPPWSQEGLLIAKMLKEMPEGNTGRYQVGEIPREHFDPDLQCVYLGFSISPAPNVWSVGEDLANGN